MKKNRLALLLIFTMIFTTIPSFANTVFAANADMGQEELLPNESKDQTVEEGTKNLSLLELNDETRQEASKETTKINSIFELPSAGVVGDDIDYSGSKLLMAKNFHIFSKEAEVNAHVNGNIATKNLIGNSNFGTKITEDGSLPIDIHYLQNISKIASSSFEARKNKVVFGSDVKIELVNNGNSLAVKNIDNLYKLDKLKISEAFQDKKDLYIDFDSVFGILKTTSDEFMAKDETPGVWKDFSEQNKRRIDVSKANIDSQKGRAILTKRDKEGQPLKGAYYNLYKDNQLIKENLVTDEQGQINLNNLEKASYYLKEIKAPKGYLLSDDKIPFDITQSNLATSDYIYLNLTKEDLEKDRPITIQGLSKNNPSVIVNVDMQGEERIDIKSPIILFIDGNKRGNKETQDFTDAKLLWNFPNTTKEILINAPFQGSLLATNAYIEVNQNLDGSMIADKVNVRSETHRWDFRGLEESGGKTVLLEAINEKETRQVTEVSGSKIWNDKDNQDGKRPEAITIRLFKNGIEIDKKIVTQADGWAWTFSDLEKYENDKAIHYTIKEDPVKGYKSQISGYDVTNNYTIEKTSLPVSKIWQDENNQDGIRPERVIIKLFADGIDTGKSLLLSESNSWMGSFFDLDKYKDGKLIVYTVKELELDGYNTIITGDPSTGYTVTNCHKPQTIEVSGSKTWIHRGNQEEKRPETITIRLLKQGMEIDRKIVTKADGWAWTFPDLEKYEKGELIRYSIVEDPVKDYDSKVDGYNVTNTYKGSKTTEVSIPKTGDMSNIGLWTGLFFLSGGGLLKVIIKKRKNF